MERGKAGESPSEYNRIAIETAQKIHAIRQSEGKRKPSFEPAREDHFPAFDRTGLGIILEYERMGNRPVSETLESEFQAQDYSLEHLGLTIGTVVRGIDLRTIDAAKAQLLRKLLLERKVIFFHEQNLDEDQQVALGRHFGELDAFPFGPPGA